MSASRQLPVHEETNERKMKHVNDTQWVNHSHPRKVGSRSEANIASRFRKGRTKRMERVPKPRNRIPKSPSSSGSSRLR